MIKGNVCKERACVACIGNGLPDVPLDNAFNVVQPDINHEQVPHRSRGDRRGQSPQSCLNGDAIRGSIRGNSKD